MRKIIAAVVLVSALVVTSMASAATTFVGAKGADAFNMVAVGYNDLGGRGFNADVWVHKTTAYVGRWGFTDWASRSDSTDDRFCVGSEVAVVDVADPTSPRQVSSLDGPAGTSVEDVVVYTARYGPYRGKDIAAVGIQWCAGSRYDQAAERGIMLFDVTKPSTPVKVGYWKVACCTRGAHEFEIADRADLRRTFAYASVPASGYPDSSSRSGVRDINGDGDFRLVDITDPSKPFQVSEWGVSDVGGPLGPGLGCDPDPNYGHGAEPSDDGKLAFLSYWDSGFIALDLTVPTSPKFLGTTRYQADEDGDAHSAVYDQDRKLLFSADEDFCKNSTSSTEVGYGYLRVWNYSNPAAPVEIETFQTQNSLGIGSQGSGDYTIHNPLLVGTDLYLSWYSDGVRVVDTRDPRNLVEVAYFVPPAGQNPIKPSQRGVLSNTTQVWGVAVDDRGYVFLSDMNTGLWIVKRTN